MRRVAVPFLGILLLVLAPALVSAQMLPGLPSFGGFFPGKAACGEDSCVGIAPPIFYVGWGFSGQEKGVTFTASPDNPTTTFDVTLNDLRNQGIWLGLSETAWLSNYLGAQASGWILIPTGGPGEATYLTPGQAPTVGRQSWSVDRQWGWLEGDVLLGSCSGGFAMIGGFRWDYHSLRFRNPTGVTIDRIADVTSSAYLPLIGGQYSQSTTNNNVLLKVVFWPWPIGTLKYAETLPSGIRPSVTGNYGSGYFVEAMAEYSRGLGGGMGGLGVFGRYSAMHGQVGSTALDFLGTGTSLPYTMGFTRTAWTFGGSLTLNFSMPF